MFMGWIMEILLSRWDVIVYFLNCLWGLKFMNKGYPRNPKALTPQEESPFQNL